MVTTVTTAGLRAITMLLCPLLILLPLLRGFDCVWEAPHVMDYPLSRFPLQGSANRTVRRLQATLSYRESPLPRDKVAREGTWAAPIR